MGLPRIAYNGKNIDLPEDVSVLPWEPRVVATQTRTVGGIVETLVQRTDVMVTVEWDLLASDGDSDTTRKRQLRQLSQWAQAGNAFAFARDRDKTVHTALDADAAAGDSGVTVEDAAGIAAGDECVIRDAVRSELVRAASVSGTTVTLEEVLDFDWSAGARFRHAEFWPARLAPGTDLIVERPPLHFGARFDFIEDVNDL